MIQNLKAAWVLFALGALVHVSGCALFKGATDTGSTCTPEGLAKIEAAFQAESITACRAEGAKTPESCKALPAIRAKHRAARDAWVRCGQ